MNILLFHITQVLMFPLGIYLAVVFKAWTVLQDNEALFSKVVILIYSSTSNVITLIPIPFKLDVLDFLTSIGNCKMVALCAFHVLFPDNEVEQCFMLICSISFFVKCLFKSFVQFFN